VVEEKNGCESKKSFGQARAKESRDALRWARLYATRLGLSVGALSVIESPDLCTLEVPDDLKAEMSLLDRDLRTRETKRLRRLESVLKQKRINGDTSCQGHSVSRDHQVGAELRR
jgi:hypothetical protein